MPPEEISSPQNPRVKQVVRLRDARQRQKQGRFLIEGARELLRALDAGIDMEQVFACPAACDGTESQQALRMLQERGIALIFVPPPLMEKLSFGGRREGLVGVAIPPRITLNDLRIPANPVIAVLEGVEKPGNVGAVLRSADGAGVSAVLVADAGTDLYNPNTIRASLGTIFTVRVCAPRASEAHSWLRDRGVKLYAARVDAELPYTQADFRGPAAIILGSEARGLSSAWSGSDVVPLRLPMCGAADSLNVSAAAAVLFYEARRQRDA